MDVDARLQRYSIEAHASLSATLQCFAAPLQPGQRKRTCLSVVDSEGRLCGIITEQNAIKAALSHSPAAAASLPASAFCVAPEKLSVCTTDVFLRTNPITLATLLARAGFKHLPIVNGENVPHGILDAVAVSELLCSSTRDASGLVVNLTAKTKRVLMVKMDDTVARVAQAMIDASTCAAIVRAPGSTHDRALGGLCTMSDILKRCPHAAWNSTRVSSIMTGKSDLKTLDVRRLRGAADYLAVLVNMSSRGFRHMPIVTTFHRAKKTVMIVDDVLDILQCNRALTEGLSTPEGILVPLPARVSPAATASPAAEEASTLKHQPESSGSEAAITAAAQTTSPADGTHGEPQTAAGAAQSHSCGGDGGIQPVACIPLNALDYKKLADLRGAYAAVENGRRVSVWGR